MEFAGELFDGVFGGDEADGGAVLVDDDGDFAAALLELEDEVKDGLGFWDHEDVTHDLADAHLDDGCGSEAGGGGAAEVHEAGEVFGVEDADDVLGAALLVVDGDAGVLMVNEAGAGGFNERVAGQGDDLLTRGHDFAYGDLVDFEGAVDDTLLKGRQDAVAPGGRGEEFELFRGVDGDFASHGHAEEAEHEARGGLQQVDGGPGDGHEEQHGAGDGDGEGFRATEGEGFGDELAEEDVEVRDEAEADDDGGEVGEEDGVGQAFKEAEEEIGGEGFADPAESERAEGNAELAGGEEAFEVGLEAADGERAGEAGGDHLLDAGFADGDEGELCGDEEAVGQDEQGYGDDLKKRQAVHLGLSLSVGEIGVRAAASLFADEPRLEGRDVAPGVHGTK